MDRTDPVAQIRSAVGQFIQRYVSDAQTWCVALSGGPDSLALTAVAAGLLPTTALIVDHGLQHGSAAVAEMARAHALDLGCIAAQVIPVTVGGEGGPEAAARSARYGALEEARDGVPVLIGHTLDDQAETVLLGLGRGSGPRSIAGIAPYDPPWCRPLLGVRRATTEAACIALDLQPWRDPHNRDRRFTRTRLRHEVLPLLEEVLGGGVAEALSRTATALQEDNVLLDKLAEDGLAQAYTGENPPNGISALTLANQPVAVRLRVIRVWLQRGGARDLSSRQIRSVDALVTAWRGQGGVAVGSGVPGHRLFAERRADALVLRTEPI